MSDEKDELKAHGEDVHIGEIYSEESEKTVFKALGLGGCLSGGAPCVVDVKNGKIVRFGPLQSLGLSLSQAS